VKIFIIEKGHFYKGLSKDSYNKSKLLEIWDDNKLLNTLKRDSQFQKCGILNFWKFKVCTFENSNFQKCFITYKWGIMYMMYWTKL